MPIKLIETRRLYRHISDQLRTLIVNGEYPSGASLPSERTLSQRFGVSRPSLREALIALEVEGFVEVRMGKGIYVCPPSMHAKQAVDLSGEEAPFEVMRARSLIEGEIAANAANMITKLQLDALGEVLELMERKMRAGEDYLDADRLFHVTVAQATDNSVLVDVAERLFDARLGQIFRRLEEHFTVPEVVATTIKEHRDILEALRSRSPSRARAAMRRHLDNSQKRFARSLKQSPTASKAKPAKRPKRVALNA